MSKPPSIDGDNYQRMLDGKQLSERHRLAVTNRAEDIRKSAVQEFLRRAEQTGNTTAISHASAYATQRINNDVEIKADIGGEQWGFRLTTMYGILHLTDEFNMLNNEVASLHDRINDIHDKVASMNDKVNDIYGLMTTLIQQMTMNNNILAQILIELKNDN